MIKLVSVTMKNFLSHRDSTIDLRSYSGVTLIRGVHESGGESASNGAGKSTCLDAIYYGITGKTMRGLTGDSIINRNYGKDCSVTLEFMLDGETYEITRYRKDKKHGNDVVFMKGDTDLSGTTATATQKVIDELINIPADVLSGVLIMGEGLSNRFTMLSDAAKKSLFESTIHMSHDVDEIRDKCKSQHAEVLNRINQITGQKISLQQRKSNLEQMKTIDIDQVRARFKEVQDSEAELISKINEIAPRVRALAAQIDSLTTHAAAALNAKYNYDQLSYQEQDLENKISTASSDTPTCPLCHQYLTDPNQVISDLQSQISSLEEQKKILEPKAFPRVTIEMAQTKISSLRQSSDSLFSEQNDYNHQRSQLRSEIESLSRIIYQYDNAVGESSDLDSEIESLDKELEALKIKDKHYTYLEKSVFSSTGVITLILDSVVKYVDTRLQVYLNVLIPEKKVHLTFKKGKIALDSETGAYASLSNGEKRRLDVCIAFALHDYLFSRSGCGFDVMFIDEILDVVDTTGCENIFDAIRMKCDYCGIKTVFLISHNSDIKESCDSVITVRKFLNGDSAVEE